MNSNEKDDPYVCQWCNDSVDKLLYLTGYVFASFYHVHIGQFIFRGMCYKMYRAKNIL